MAARLIRLLDPVTVPVNLRADAGLEGDVGVIGGTRLGFTGGRATAVLGFDAGVNANLWLAFARVIASADGSLTAELSPQITVSDCTLDLRLTASAGARGFAPATAQIGTKRNC
jgi:hypothetical protein